METTLGLLQERFFWPKKVDDMHVHIRTCDRCTRFKKPQERTGMKPILVCYPLELIHLEVKVWAIEVSVFQLSLIISPNMPKYM